MDDLNVISPRPHTFHSQRLSDMGKGVLDSSGSKGLALSGSTSSLNAGRKKPQPSFHALKPRAAPISPPYPIGIALEGQARKFNIISHLQLPKFEI